MLRTRRAFLLAAILGLGFAERSMAGDPYVLVQKAQPMSDLTLSIELAWGACPNGVDKVVFYDFSTFNTYTYTGNWPGSVNGRWFWSAYPAVPSWNSGDAMMVEIYKNGISLATDGFTAP